MGERAELPSAAGSPIRGLWRRICWGRAAAAEAHAAREHRGRTLLPGILFGPGRYRTPLQIAVSDPAGVPPGSAPHGHVWSTGEPRRGCGPLLGLAFEHVGERGTPMPDSTASSSRSIAGRSRISARVRTSVRRGAASSASGPSVVRALSLRSTSSMYASTAARSGCVVRATCPPEVRYGARCHHDRRTAICEHPFVGHVSPPSLPTSNAPFSREPCGSTARAAPLSTRQLRLLFLHAEKEPIKYERAALRWLARYASEGKAVSLLKAQLAVSALAELRSGEREQAAKLLTELARR
jgi:hypothetical protein